MKNFNRKSLLVIACIALVLTVTVGGTLAYLADKSGPVVNTFVPTKVTCEVDESPFTDGTSITKENVRIQNTGTTSAYIRAVVVGNWVKNGKIVKAWSDNISYNTADWTKTDGYWYYKSAVGAGDYTTNLFDTYTAGTAPVAGAHLELTIVCQAVQSQGLPSSVTSAKAAFDYVAEKDPAK